MKTPSFLGTYRALFLAVVAFTPLAHGAGIFIDACGVNQNFAGGFAVVAHCSIGTAADNAIGGSAAVAGNNFFVNNLSPIHFYGDTDAFAGVATWTVTSNPVFDAGVTTVGTFLRLDGSVKMQGPGSSLVITLTGLLGGAANPGDRISITRTFNWTGQPTEDILNIPLFVEQFKANQAIETLTIAINGRARYDVDGSPQFDGAVPEPTTWTSLVFGVATLLAWRRSKL